MTALFWFVLLVAAVLVAGLVVGMLVGRRIDRRFDGLRDTPLDSLPAATEELNDEPDRQP